MERRHSFLERWPTGVVLMLLLTAALLPLGLVLAWVAQQSVWETRRANISRAETQGVAASQAIESLLARNVLALRIASSKRQRKIDGRLAPLLDKRIGDGREGRTGRSEEGCISLSAANGLRPLR